MHMYTISKKTPNRYVNERRTAKSKDIFTSEGTVILNEF